MQLGLVLAQLQRGDLLPYGEILEDPLILGPACCSNHRTSMVRG
jgi:hypothetical protein